MDNLHLGVRLRDAFNRHASRPATRIRRGDEWDTRTYASLTREARLLAEALVGLGVGVGDRVALFSANRPEWSLVDVATLWARGVVVPLYPTSTPEQVRHIVRDSGSVVVVVAGASELARLLEVSDDLPDLRHIITLDAAASDDPRVQSLEQLRRRPNDDAAAAVVERRLADADADELASIIYTSGTTGEPRGVMLTHRAFTFELDSLESFLPVSPDDSSLCFLPLSHSLERAWTFFVLTHGCLNTYVPDARTVAEMMVLAQPTMLVSVPRLYEKVFTAVHDKVAGSKPKAALFEWAIGVGTRAQHHYRAGRQPGRTLRAQLAVADKLIFRSVRAAMGGQKSVMACGGAPLRQEIEEFFSAAGMLLLQGYGLTEAAPLVTFNAPEAFKFGTCGRVVTGGELRIGEGGEVLYRGGNVMAGYWNLPEMTEQTVDADGWLHTGDVGYVDTDGFLVITDRIKDIIVTSNGKNVSPSTIEGVLLADPLFEHAVILGDNRPFLTLLVAPSLVHLEEIAKTLQIAFSDRAELLRHPQVLAEIKRRVAELSQRLAHHEQVQDVRVLLEELTIENGLLTPTLKVKRKEVEKRFKDLIDDMYAKLAEMRGKG